jgi:hypothetical protein
LSWQLLIAQIPENNIKLNTLLLTIELAYVFCSFGFDCRSFLNILLAWNFITPFEESVAVINKE